jgi:hypothetical protein
VDERREDPHGPESLSVAWFRSGAISVSKLEHYTLSPLHPTGQHKAKLWRSVFGLGPGQRLLLARLIFEQLTQVKAIEEREPRVHEEDPSRLTRRFTLDIPRFKGPNGNVAPVRTNWALDPDKDEPHLATAFLKKTTKR